jgi:hypothetical protein
MIPIAIRMIPRIPAGFMETGDLRGAASRDQIDDQDDDRDHQDQVDQRAPEMADETEEPKNQKNNEDSPKHIFSLGWFFLLRRTRGR